jgi:hypothetical protein
MWKEATVLRHVADATPECDGIELSRVDAFDENPSTIGRDETVEAAEKCCLPGPAFADKGETSTGLDGDGDIVECDNVAESLGNAIGAEWLGLCLV